MKSPYLYLVKFFIIFLVTNISFRLFDTNTIGFLFLIALLTTVILIIIGDGFILPAFGNLVATLIDGVTAVLIVFVIDLVSEHFNTAFFNYLIFFILILLCEYLFHRFLSKRVKVIK